MVIYLLSFLS